MSVGGGGTSFSQASMHACMHEAGSWLRRLLNGGGFKQRGVVGL